MISICGDCERLLALLPERWDFMLPIPVVLLRFTTGYRAFDPSDQAQAPRF